MPTSPFHFLTLLTAVLTVFGTELAVAQARIGATVIATGGGYATGPDVAVGATIGQPIAGRSERLLAGFWQLSGFVATATEDVRPESSIPGAHRLYQNYPNPFSASTTIRYDLPQSGPVRIAVIDVLGRVVAELLDREVPAGSHEVNWEPRGIGSGVFFFTLEAGSFVETRAMFLMQ